MRLWGKFREEREYALVAIEAGPQLLEPFSVANLDHCGNEGVGVLGSWFPGIRRVSEAWSAAEKC